jgi:hypothetical protein
VEENSVEIAEIQKKGVVRANFLDRLVVVRVEEEIEQRQTALRVALVRVRTDRAVERETLAPNTNNGVCVRIMSSGGTELDW